MVEPVNLKGTWTVLLKPYASFNVVPDISLITSSFFIMSVLKLFSLCKKYEHTNKYYVPIIWKTTTSVMVLIEVVCHYKTNLFLIKTSHWQNQWKFTIHYRHWSIHWLWKKISHLITSGLRVNCTFLLEVPAKENFLLFLCSVICQRKISLHCLSVLPLQS